jgi:hypothetical protein
MSTKDWKNGEMNTLLTEKWGFTFNLDRLDERTGDEVTPKRARTAVDKGKDDDKVETDDLKQTTEGLDEMGGCADHDAEEIVVMGDGEPGDEGPEDPQGLVDELGDLVSRLQSALGGGMGGQEDEMVVDIQERLRTVLKTIAEKQGEKDRDDERESAEDGKIADKDFKGTKKKKQKSRRDDALGDYGTRTKKKNNENRQNIRGKLAGITEDSEEKEDENYEKNVVADEKHYGSDRERIDRMEELMRELQDHIDSLRGDEKGLDHDEGYDEEHIEEGGSADKMDPRNRRQTERSKPLEEAQLRAMIRQALKKSLSK